MILIKSNKGKFRIWWL